MYKATEIFQSFFSLIIIISVFSISTFSQEKSKLPQLKENASLEEIQKWLTKGIKKISKYSIGKNVKYADAIRREYNEIPEVKFEGCKLTYILSSTSMPRQHSEVLPSREISQTSTITSSSSTSVLLDLAEMNADNIHYEASSPEGTKTIIINTITGEKSVLYKRLPTKPYNKEFYLNQSLFVIKGDAAEQIKNGLAQAIKSCRTTK